MWNRLSEAEEHRLALQDPVQLAQYQANEHARMALQTEQLLSWRSRYRRESLTKLRGRLLRLDGPSAPSLPQDPPGLPPSKFLASWAQYTGSKAHVGDIAVGSWHQHVDVMPNEILLLPFAVAAHLVTHYASLWRPQTVLPIDSSFTTDLATGLDQVEVVTVASWGLLYSPERVPYFAPDLGAATDDVIRLFVDDAGKPYVEKL